MLAKDERGVEQSEDGKEKLQERLQELISSERVRKKIRDDERTGNILLMHKYQSTLGLIL